VLQALRRNRAPLLSMKMPGLATAAVAPVFILVFSAEFWDAGLGMTHRTAWLYAGLSIVAAAVYLCFAQRLFLPRKDTRTVPEHLAVANAVIFLSMLLAVLGLFVMVALLALAIELWVFPPGLISTWPTLESRVVGVVDLLKIAVFISTVGVTRSRAGCSGGGSCATWRCTRRKSERGRSCGQRVAVAPAARASRPGHRAHTPAARHWPHECRMSRLPGGDRRMSNHDVTSKDAARKAAKTLASATAGKAAKSAAGSALSQRKAPERHTSRAAARAAGKTLANPAVSNAARSAAGSALTQRRGTGAADDATS
jgi:hypothetical protein